MRKANALANLPWMLLILGMTVLMSTGCHQSNPDVAKLEAKIDALQQQQTNSQLNSIDKQLAQLQQTQQQCNPCNRPSGGGTVRTVTKVEKVDLSPVVGAINDMHEDLSQQMGYLASHQAAPQQQPVQQQQQPVNYQPEVPQGPPPPMQYNQYNPYTYMGQTYQVPYNPQTGLCWTSGWFCPAMYAAADFSDMWNYGAWGMNSGWGMYGHRSINKTVYIDNSCSGTNNCNTYNNGGNRYYGGGHGGPGRPRGGPIKSPGAPGGGGTGGSPGTGNPGNPGQPGRFSIPSTGARNNMQRAWGGNGNGRYPIGRGGQMQGGFNGGARSFGGGMNRGFNGGARSFGGARPMGGGMRSFGGGFHGGGGRR